MVAEAIASSPSLRQAAAKIGVHVSTLSRMVRSGRVQGPSGRTPAETPQAPPSDVGTFAEWALGTYELTRAERELVGLAQAALDLSRDAEASPAGRLQAMGQFRQTLRDLKLPIEETETHGATTTPIRFPRPA